MEGFKVGAGDAEVADPGIGIEFLVEEPDGVFYEDLEGSVEFGKSLFVLPADHDLGLGLEGIEAMSVQFFNREGFAIGYLDQDACSTALGVGNAVDIALVTCMVD